jgi:hypothetical protein
MAENTTNFELTKPSENERDWHIPLNENFDTLDKRLVITDIEDELQTYDPLNKQAFIATDTGNIYVGDGNSWNKLSIQLGVIESDHIFLGVVSSTPFDSEIGAGNIALYFKDDNVLYKKPYGEPESGVGGDGGGGSYADSDAIAAINNDSDHGITASHNYYTDSDALTAVDSRVVDTGSVSLTNGTGTVNTGITADTGKYYDVSIMPQSSGDVIPSIEYDGSTIIVHIEEKTTANNPTVNYRLEQKP